MGCGSSSQAAGVSSPAPQARTSGSRSTAAAQTKLVPGQCAIIRNCPNARLNGERVILEKYNDLGEWTVKGDKFPLSVGMSLGAQYLEATETAQSSDTPQQAPTLLTGGANLVAGKYKDLLRTPLEKYTAMLQGQRVFDGSNTHVGEYVSDVYVHAFGIIKEGTGLGESGQCPFASAYEVHLFYQFGLNVCIAWSEHNMGKDEQLDQEFYSQIGDLFQILCFLDTSAVPLPEEIEGNIKVLQADALFPHWVDSQIPKGEAALESCVAVGQKWGLEETSAFQKAVAALENAKNMFSNAAEESTAAEEAAAGLDNVAKSCPSAESPNSSAEVQAFAMARQATVETESEASKQAAEKGRTPIGEAVLFHAEAEEKSQMQFHSMRRRRLPCC